MPHALRSRITIGQASSCELLLVEARRHDLVKQLAAEYLRALGTLLDEVDLDAVARIADRLRRARDQGAMVYVAGNGGSAATATHWVNDLGKATKRSGCPPLRVMTLHDNLPWLTALANDEGYTRVFAGQLENFARAGDVLVVISASGNSENLVSAVALASSRGVTSIGLLGFDGGDLKAKVSEYLWVPTPLGAYGLVEDAHAAVCHVLTTCLAEDRPASPAPLGQQGS